MLSKEYIRENILLDTESFHEMENGKISGKCLIEDSEMTILLPQTINRVSVLEAIVDNRLTDAILDRIVNSVYKEIQKSNDETSKGTKRVRASVDEETYHQMMYWAKKRGCSINEYLTLAIEHMISWENQDYDLPTLEQQRLNQLINSIGALASDVRCLEHITSEGFKSLLGLTRGDNYLLEEDGDL